MESLCLQCVSAGLGLIGECTGSRLYRVLAMCMYQCSLARSELSLKVRNILQTMPNPKSGSLPCIKLQGLGCTGRSRQKSSKLAVSGRPHDRRGGSKCTIRIFAPHQILSIWFCVSNRLLRNRSMYFVNNYSIKLL